MKEKYTELDYPVLVGRVLAVEGYLNTQEYLSREAIAAMLGVELKDKKEDKEKQASGGKGFDSGRNRGNWI